MTETKSKSFANSGVENHNGMALQRNTAIFLLLDNYDDKFKDKKYFICLEHHDDFLFCFLNKNDDVSLIEAYQSKKKSPDKWTLTLLNNEKVILKLLETGKKLRADEISKSSEYQHILYFSSNQKIDFGSKPNYSIKETDPHSRFQDLPDDTRKKIREQISNIDSDLCSELANLGFIHIPFQQIAKHQTTFLIGKISEFFENKISDSKAALETLTTLFRRIEETYSKGNEAQLLDETKRVDYKKIDETFNILTTQAKAFDFWREQTESVLQSLKIESIHEEQFRFNFETAFDCFKSIQNAEHANILSFVKENIRNLNAYGKANQLGALLNLFQKTNDTNFEDLQLKAILFAAYFEVLNIKESQNEISTHL